MTHDTTLSQSNNRIVEHILKVEGWPSYTNDPHDRGSATKGGITLATLRDWRGDQKLGVGALKSLPQAEAEAIYRQRYIVGPGFGAIADELLRFQVVDAGVLSGPFQATKWLQEAAGVLVDGKLGPKTAAAVNGMSAHRLGIAFAVLRLRFIGRLIERDRTQAKWAAGWANRATRFLKLEAERAA